ncbi:MAG: hypothetical protein IJ303_04070 [Clostridia bacterium]|nr:hypothetical protein [Clostridia bacterium]
MAFVCLAALLCLKSLRENFAPLLRAAAVLLLFGIAASSLTPFVSFSSEAVAKIGAIEYQKTVFKALGIAYLTHITAQVCRDCGEGGLAQGVETAGKFELLLLALPLIKKIFAVAEEMLLW